MSLNLNQKHIPILHLTHWQLLVFSYSVHIIAIYLTYSYVSKDKLL
uniref:Uncharacterized protein n=1 Tax=Rhizophora mucronata TaxID=61149 RepID=A0A2P2NJT0_RHIMU